MTFAHWLILVVHVCIFAIFVPVAAWWSWRCITRGANYDLIRESFDPQTGNRRMTERERAVRRAR